MSYPDLHRRTDDPYLERIMDAQQDEAEARAIRADEEAELEAERRLSRQEAGLSDAGAVDYAQHTNTNKGDSQ